MTTERGGHRIFAALYGVMSRSMEAGPIGAARRELVSQARGEVLDLGAGRGANLPHLGSEVSRVHLLEPDPHMLKRLRPLAPANAVVHPVAAERLPLEDTSIDTVLATLMLCSVTDPEAVAGEIHRVLKPGGRLLVLEHVRAEDARQAHWQDRLDRPWGWVSGSCHANRDTSAVLAAAGFDTTSLTRFQGPGLPIVRPWISGVLTVR